MRLDHFSSAGLGGCRGYGLRTQSPDRLPCFRLVFDTVKEAMLELRYEFAVTLSLVVA